MVAALALSGESSPGGLKLKEVCGAKHPKHPDLSCYLEAGHAPRDHSHYFGSYDHPDYGEVDETMEWPVQEENDKATIDGWEPITVDIPASLPLGPAILRLSLGQKHAVLEPGSRLWINPYTGKERLVIHVDPAKCEHGAGSTDEVCQECCTCNAHSGCGCCDCPWFGEFDQEGRPFKGAKE